MPKVIFCLLCFVTPSQPIQSKTRFPGLCDWLEQCFCLHNTELKTIYNKKGNKAIRGHFRIALNLILKPRLSAQFMKRFARSLAFIMRFKTTQYLEMVS